MRPAQGPAAPLPSAKRPAGPPSVCVIGAGCSGLVSARALLEVGVTPTVYELGSDVGGLWLFESDSGKSAAYRSLTINTSRRQMQLGEFPMPESYGDFPRHELIHRYFVDYARHFGLTETIRFRTEVQQATPLAGGGYRVRTRQVDSGEVEEQDFDAVVVASGHHHRPAFPEPTPPGEFSGESLHAHAYRDPENPIALAGRRVLVVGLGNSAVDIASELAEASPSGTVLVSTRRGAWVLPKYLFGRPIDEGTIIPRWLPARLRRRLVTLGFRWVHGSMPDFGLPEPDHLIGEAHPTMSSVFPNLVRRGRIGIRGRIERFDQKLVHFEGGQADEIDAIVYATGYAVEFPFFEPHHIAAPDNELPLFRRVFHPHHPSVFFVGLAQPIGAILPIARAQAGWVAEHLVGNYNLPSESAISTELEAERRAIADRYVSSRRHTMQIDPPEYMKALQKELARGRRRAERGEGRAFRP